LEEYNKVFFSNIIITVIIIFIIIAAFQIIRSAAYKKGGF